MSKRILPYAMWVFPLSFFTYQFILRLWPSLMMRQIMEQFHIDATGFGLLASVYYYGYAVMQIPVAIFLDRFGARHVVCLCALTCGLATMLFTFTESWTLALISRFLVGAGSAAGFLATSKVISQWFSRAHYARMVGFSFTIGLLGAIYGGKPVSLLVENNGWQQVASVLAWISIAIGILTMLFLKESKAQSDAKESALCLRDLGKLLNSSTIWILALSNLLMVGALEGFADVWGANYLMTAMAVSKADAAGYVSAIFIGMLFGGPLLAAWAKQIGNYSVIAICSLGMVLAFLALLFANTNFSAHSLLVLFFGVGILCCYQVLVFASGSDLVTPTMLGVTVAFLNCVNMLGGSFFHSSIGLMMDHFWTGSVTNGIRNYSIESYQCALTIIPVCALIGGLMVMYLGLQQKRKKSVSIEMLNR